MTVKSFKSPKASAESSSVTLAEPAQSCPGKSLPCAGSAVTAGLPPAHGSPTALWEPCVPSQHQRGSRHSCPPGSCLSAPSPGQTGCSPVPRPPCASNNSGSCSRSKSEPESEQSLPAARTGKDWFAHSSPQGRLLHCSDSWNCPCLDSRLRAASNFFP